MKTYHNVTMTQPIAYALYKCGEGVIDYTRGVLDTLGLSDLATELESARGEWLHAVAERDKHSTPSADALMAQFGFGEVPARLEEAVTVARRRLDEALGKLEILREQARHFEDARTGGGVS